ncbi:unnamed protein product [Cylicocyclus nassatus]|uniref:lysoplasmalogenase n=1 Tax=Cylicocyclus nassatus TaxID=53992 RepID=A0AA36HCT5_CYLNA|nr:unnamed protein product [Cylicocyclus nassatus]
MLFLVLFAALDGGGLPQQHRTVCALGLLFGTIGDFLLGISKHGLIPGAVAFGIGHLFYMSLFISRPIKIYWPVVYFTAAWGVVIAILIFLPVAKEHPIAVFLFAIYAVILKLCLIITTSQYIHRDASDKDEGLYYRFLGFSLFYLSDSVLILGDAGFPIPFSGKLCLAAYYSAQFLILCGNIHSGLYVKNKTA